MRKYLREKGKVFKREAKKLTRTVSGISQSPASIPRFADASSSVPSEPHAADMRDAFESVTALGTANPPITSLPVPTTTVGATGHPTTASTDTLPSPHARRGGAGVIEGATSEVSASGTSLPIQSEEHAASQPLRGQDGSMKPGGTPWDTKDKAKNFVSQAGRILARLGGVEEDLQKITANRTEIQSLKRDVNEMLSSINSLGDKSETHSLSVSLSQVTMVLKETNDFLDKHVNDEDTESFGTLSAMAASAALAEELETRRKKLALALESFEFSQGVRMELGISAVQAAVTDIGDGVQEMHTHVQMMRAELEDGHNDQAKMSTIMGHVATGVEHVHDATKDLRAGMERIDERLSAAERLRLRGLFPKAVSWWDGQHACLPNTRQVQIAKICRWARLSKDPNTPNVLWLRGMAGCGKSTIAHSISEELASSDQSLVIAFFFQRGVSGCDDPLLLPRLLARELSAEGQPLSLDILSALADDETLLQKAPMHQLSKLLLEPISAFMKRGGRLRPYTVIWDAIDECGDAESREPILALLRQHLHSLGSVLQFVVTSRPDPDITVFMSKVAAEIEDLTPETSGTQNDIDCFFRHHVNRIREEKDLPSTWPDESEIEGLSSRAGGLFIWASTAVRLLRKEIDPTEMLQELTKVDPSSSGEQTIDRLYITVLQVASSRANIGRHFEAIVGAILSLFDPLSAAALSELMFPSTKGLIQVSGLVQQLGAVLQVDENGLIKLLHQSFRDFLSQRCSLHEFRIDIKTQHSVLAAQCLGLIHQRLKRDICGIGDPTRKVAEVPNLSELLHTNVSDALRYACLNWINHILAVDTIQSLSEPLETFFIEDLLFWMEIVSLLGQLSEVLLGLKGLQSHLQKLLPAESELSAAAYDGLRFLEQFGPLVKEYPGQLYISALAFSPRDTALYRHYFSRFCQSTGLEVKSGYRSTWSPCRMILESAQSYTVVCVSENGSVIAGAEGSYRAWLDHSYTIQLWSGDTGLLLGDRLYGHTDVISCLCLSSEGSRLVSGSNDATVRVWNTSLGVPLFAPLIMTASVLWVGLSRDGTRLVSGQKDGVAGVWDAVTGAALHIMRVAESHVLSLSLSLDAGRVVANLANEACYDGDFHVWDLMTGAHIAELPQSTSERDVIISSDGSMLATMGNMANSFLKILKVWDADTGTLLHEIPFDLSEIGDFCISSDGCYLISGAGSTVNVWDLRQPEPIRQELRGHSAQILSVDSQDGRRVVSASGDGIRVWDVPPQLTSNISSPTPSPDFELIVSTTDGSRVAIRTHAGAVQLLDGLTGATLLGPFTAWGGLQEILYFGNNEQELIWEGIVMYFKDESGRKGRLLKKVTWNLITGEEQIRHRKVKRYTNEDYDDDSESGVNPDANAGPHVRGGADGIDGGEGEEVGSIGEEHKIPKMVEDGNDESARGIAVKQTVPSEVFRVIEWERNHDREEAGRCELQHDGWVVTPNGQLLCWIPQDLRTHCYITPARVMFGSDRGNLFILHLPKEDAVGL